MRAITRFRIHASREKREARAYHADVDRALDVLGAENGRIQGSVRDLRRRWDALLDELHPAPAPPSRWGSLLRRLGLDTRTRAADAGSVSLFDELPFGAEWIALEYKGGTEVTERGIESVSPAECLRSRVADALDDAYAALLPHEAARQAELRRRFFSQGCGSRD